MSGHSKWHSIKHKKGALDAKRGKIFTMHAKVISITARNGADPEMNPALRTAIDRAKADNVPNANIDRAIKKGAGLDKDADAYEEVTYEAFGPEGTVFMIDCITDNKNRTFTNLRTLIAKAGGNLGSAGTVAWKFERKGFLSLTAPAEAELDIIDAGAEDLSVDEQGHFEIYTAPDSLGQVRDVLIAKGYKPEKEELIWKAKESMPITDLATAEKMMKFMEKIDDDEDVNHMYTNADIDSSLLSQLG